MLPYPSRAMSGCDMAYASRPNTTTIKRFDGTVLKIARQDLLHSPRPSAIHRALDRPLWPKPKTQPTPHPTRHTNCQHRRSCSENQTNVEDETPLTARQYLAGTGRRRLSSWPGCGSAFWVILCRYRPFPSMSLLNDCLFLPNLGILCHVLYI